jgi:hypothetical protein
MKFSVPSLVADGVLTADSTELTIRGFLSDGSAITGTDTITVNGN